MLGRRFTTCLALVLLLAACQRQGSEPAASGVKVEVINGVTTYTNRLITEKSPYLQRHAHNPVDWYPWGQDAFDRARRENKPIFLSIGYSTCHWCHVMEEESFSNPTIAALMNASFVSIKVDREEHPDVDRVYLAYVTSVNGGGWPMSLFLTPDLKPFFGATYMPPDTRGREEGFRSVLQRVAAQWASSRDVLIAAANEGSTTVMAQARIPKASDDVESTSVAALDGTFDAIARSFDGVNGGFGGAPKFPRPVVMTFLLRHFARTGEVRARDMALDTLRAMARSAIHDHLGGGFHRYTVDAAWQIPHFEKMLYDQALVSMAYTEAYQLTRDEALASTARDTLDYVRQTLRSPAGGFYSAEDADSLTSASDARLAEGAFYVWTPQELTRALGSSQAALVAYHFGVTDEGNLAVPGASADSLGKSALGERHTLRETAAQFRLTEPAARARLDDALGALARVRATRPRPARDDKIIAAWNGLMISAFARAGQAFDNRADVDAAVSAARFIESRMYDAATGTLKRRARQDAVDLDGLLEDYAFVIQGCLDVFEASFDPRWLRLASRLQQTQDTLFWDQKDGGYFSTRAGAAHLLARMKEDYDGPEPAANSVSALNLVRLWQLTSVDLWRARADATFTALSGRIARSGSAVPQLMSALDFRRSTTKEIVIAGTPGAPDTAALLRLVHDRFLPNKVLALADGGRGQVDLAEVVPFVEAMNMRDGKATIYVCENYVCRLPTNDLAVAARLLDSRAATRRP